jgi:hypothetical protein
VVVADVEPLQLPILVGVYQLIQQVLPDSSFTHLHPGTSDYPRVICASLGLLPKELLNKIQWGLITMNASQKWTKLRQIY